MAWSGSAWPFWRGVTWRDLAWCGSVWLGSARLGSARLGWARLGSARCGSFRFSSVRLGLWFVVCWVWLVACGGWYVACGFGCGLATIQEPITVTRQQMAMVFGDTVKPQHDHKNHGQTTKTISDNSDLWFFFIDTPPSLSLESPTHQKKQHNTCYYFVVVLLMLNGYIILKE